MPRPINKILTCIHGLGRATSFVQATPEVNSVAHVRPHLHCGQRTSAIIKTIMRIPINNKTQFFI